MSGKRLWRVDMVRTQNASLYIEAEFAEDAIMDAGPLVGEDDWFGPVAEWSAEQVQGSEGQEFWSGGLGGTWQDPR